MIIPDEAVEAAAAGSMAFENEISLEEGRKLLLHGKGQPHAGDCTKMPFTCMRCVYDAEMGRARAALEAALPAMAEPAAWAAEGPGWKQVFLNREAAEKLASDGSITALYASPVAPAAAVKGLTIADLCSDCPPVGYPTDKTRCEPCPRRSALSQPTDAGWRAMDSAPKDRFILLWCAEDNSRWLAKWQGGRWYGVDDQGLTREGHAAGDPGVVTGWAVNGWRPLPASPRASSPSEAEGGERR